MLTQALTWAIAVTGIIVAGCAAIATLFYLFDTLLILLVLGFSALVWGLTNARLEYLEAQQTPRPPDVRRPRR